MGTLFVSIILCILVIVVIRKLRNDKKNNKGCGGNCSGCGGNCPYNQF